MLKGTVNPPTPGLLCPLVPRHRRQALRWNSVLTHRLGSRPARAGLVPGTLRTVSTRLQCLQCPPLLPIQQLGGLRLACEEGVQGCSRGWAPNGIGQAKVESWPTLPS